MDRFVSAVCGRAVLRPRLFISRFLPGLEWPIFPPLIKCGQQSLEVFCVGVFLAVGAHVVLVKISDAIWMQIAVSVLGIAMLKKADKSNSPAVRRPMTNDVAVSRWQEHAANQRQNGAG